MNRLEGRKGFFVMKVDLPKVYGMMTWNFVNKVLIEIGFPDKLRQVIMDSMTTLKMYVLWKG